MAKAESGFLEAVALLRYAHPGDEAAWEAMWHFIAPERQLDTVWQLCLLADAWLELAAREGDVAVETVLDELTRVVEA